MSSKKLLSSSSLRGLHNFTQFLTKERQKFRTTPIVLLTQQDDESTTTASSSHHKIQQQVSFLLQQHMGLRTVPTTTTTVGRNNTNAALPHALYDIPPLLKVAQRVGARTLVAVGSGTVMDIAKAAAGGDSSPFSTLVLIPSTYSALWVAHTSHALVIDDDNENLLFPHKINKETTSTIVAAFDKEFFDQGPSRSIALWAALAMKMDSSYQQQQQMLTDEEMLLTTAPSDDNHDALVNLMESTGRSVSYGMTTTRPRNIPLAVAAALSGDSPMFSTMASFYPVYRDILQLDSLPGEAQPPQIMSNDSFETVYRQIRNSALHWGCKDAPEQEFRRILFSRHLRDNSA